MKLFTKKLFHRIILWPLAILTLALGSVCANGAGEVVDFDAQSAISKLGASLTTNLGAHRNRLYAELTRLGFDSEVTNLKDQTGDQLHMFSARSVLVTNKFSLRIF